MNARPSFFDTACQIVSPPRAVTPEREAEIAARYPAYCERMARYGLEALSAAGYRYTSLTLEERITHDHGADVAASLMSGPAQKGTFERAYALAADRKAVR